MELAHPFIRLPFRFDVERLKAELDQFDPSQWMAHPNRMQGNAAIPLISLNGEDNDDFVGHMQTTKHLGRCDYMQQVMASFGEVLSRSRLMRLGGQSEVSEHVDFNYHWYSRVRIHIPITTTPDVLFYCGDQKVHMQAGECWIFDSWRRHKVINSGNENRVHLVIDIAGSSRFWKMVREMETLGISPNAGELENRIVSKPFIKDQAAEIKTERYNVSPVMAPGELNAIARELISDFSKNTNNDTQLIEKYSNILLNLSHDWREAWHIYGHEEAGWPRYRELLQQTFNQLGDNPSELVTASNSVGVRPIIVQRILRAAFNVQQFELFD